MLLFWKLFVAFSGGATAAEAVCFLEIGGIPDNPWAAVWNGEVFASALVTAAPYTELVLPAGYQWHMIPARHFDHLEPFVTVRIEGQLVASNAIDLWPLHGNDYMSLIGASDSEGFGVVGSGSVLGQGLEWWWAFALGKLNEAKRPVLIDIDSSTDVRVEGLALLDAPRFNVFLGENVRRATVRDLTILVDWKSQLEIFPAFMFPFNTDGIDVAGTDIVIENCVVSNWDDVVAVKPSTRRRRREDMWTWCTRNVAVVNLTTVWGVGVSVGSVHPARNQPCVRDVLFKNIEMWRPLKGVYVKPDVAEPGCDDQDEDSRRLSPCRALVDNVSYVDIAMYKAETPDWWEGFQEMSRLRGLPFGYVSTTPLGERAKTRRKSEDQEEFTCGKYDFLCFLWPVSIGVQQQLEPDGSGSGIWPDPDPRTTVSNISLTRITATGGSWPEGAGVIRCNETNPCSGLTFTDVDIQADTFGYKPEWVCDSPAFGSVRGTVTPDVSRCLSPRDPLNTSS